MASASSVGLTRGERGDQQARARDVEQCVGERHVGGSRPARVRRSGLGCSGTKHTACRSSADAGRGACRTRPSSAATATRTPPSRHGTTLSGWPSSAVGQVEQAPPRPAGCPGSDWRSARRRRSRRRCCPGLGRMGCGWCSAARSPGTRRRPASKTALRGAQDQVDHAGRGSPPGWRFDLVPQVEGEPEAIEARAQIGAGGRRAHDYRRLTHNRA